MSISQRIKRVTRVFFQPAPPNPPLDWQSIPAIEAADLGDIQLFFARPKYFIFGHARSGTTLLARLIRVHPDVHCNWQAHFFTRQPFLHSLVQDASVQEWLSRRSNRWNQGKDLSPLVMRVAADFILEREAAQLGKRIVGDKSPNSLVNGDAVLKMHQIYPDARLIYIVRDGRDAVLSHRFQSFIDKAENLTEEDLAIRQAFSQDPTPFLNGKRSLFTPKGLRRAAQGWVDNVTQTDSFAKKLYGESYYSLRFEDLIRNPWEKMCQIWDFLGADIHISGLQEELLQELQQNPDSDWQQQKASEIAQVLQKGKSGGWREMFTGADRQQFLEIAATTLAEWGYPLE
ncbi:MAG: sulfotransferase family protein [Anaerolineales bacterium]